MAETGLTVVVGIEMRLEARARGTVVVVTGLNNVVAGIEVQIKSGAGAVVVVPSLAAVATIVVQGEDEDIVGAVVPVLVTGVVLTTSPLNTIML